MIVIIVDNFCHRLMNDGTVQSATVFNFVDKVEKSKTYPNGVNIGTGINEDWHIADPVTELQMNPGEFHQFITKDLQMLNAIFPADRPKLPVSEHQENVAQERTFSDK